MPESRTTPPPSVPGFRHLGWLLFMQPFKFHATLRALQLDNDPSLWNLCRRRRHRDEAVQSLMLKLTGWLCGSTPLLACGLTLVCQGFGLPVSWPLVAWAIVLAVGVGALGAMVGGMAAGVAWGVILGALGGVGFGTAGGIDAGSARFIAAAVVGGATLGMALGVARGVASGRALGARSIIWGLLGGLAIGLAADPLGGATFFAAFLTLHYRLPFFLVEIAVSSTLVLLLHLTKVRTSTLARFLPFRHDDLIYFPLPGLCAFIVKLADDEPVLAQALISEAFETLGQKRPANLALIELQARSLEYAGRERLYSDIVALKLPFLSSLHSLPEESLLQPLTAVANELRAAQMSRNHQHRREAIKRAKSELEGVQLRFSQLQWPGPASRRSLLTIRFWREEVLVREEEILAKEEDAHPQVPRVFIPGPVLGPQDRELFKGRQDLIHMIDHDLTGKHRAAIFLYGQRRMGKSSFLNMLPEQLGGGSIVVSLSFQGLSGETFRSYPHRWIAAEVAHVWPEGPPPPQTSAWGETLAWLHELDTSPLLADRRLLVALDEIERLEDAIRQGWANTDLLDMIRAAGDNLQSIRFLLASAHSLPRLGPHWVDRLINVLPREIRPLEEEAARELICQPTSGFPDIYPVDGVEKILAETRGHPYLIQLVCDQLCHNLNQKRRIKATSNDLQIALDRAQRAAHLFDDLWNERTDDERTVLQRLLRGEECGEALRFASRELERDGYIARHDDQLTIVLPMFATWIRDKI